jgi:hypothetical protein
MKIFLQPVIKTGCSHGDYGDDEISRLFAVSTPYLAYSRTIEFKDGQSTETGKTVVIKIDVAGKSRILTKEMLAFNGWKIYTSLDDDFVILSNGKTHKVVGHDLSIPDRVQR